MERPDRFDPYRVLGIPPGASLNEVKATYRRLAKRHHPDTAGPSELAHFLRVQAAYEMIARSHGNATRSTGNARPAGQAPRGPERDAGSDWYTAAREAARARSHTRRGQETGPRERAGGAAGGAEGGPTATKRGSGADDGRRDRFGRRKATLGSTTYDDAVTEPPDWDGSAWYGAASGTYWTMNPREYADPRKHGPEYFGRTAEWAGEGPKPAASASGRGEAAPGGGAASATRGRVVRVARAIRSMLDRL